MTLAYSRVDKGRTDTERLGHPLERERLVTLQDLGVRLDPHLSYVIPRMGCKDWQRGKVGLLDFGYSPRIQDKQSEAECRQRIDTTERTEEFGVVAFVKGFGEGGQGRHLRQ